MIDLHATYTAVLQAIHPGVGMKHLLPALTDLIQTRVLPKQKYSLSIPPVLTFAPTEIAPSTSPVRHSYFWPRLQEFVLEGDIIVAEPGTAFFGALDMRLPTGACIIAQYLWCSIGFGTAACSGAAVAEPRDRPRRDRRAALELAALAALRDRLAASQRVAAGDGLPGLAHPHLGARQLRVDLADRRGHLFCAAGNALDAGGDLLAGAGDERCVRCRVLGSAAQLRGRRSQLLRRTGERRCVLGDLCQHGVHGLVRAGGGNGLGAR